MKRIFTLALGLLIFTSSNAQVWWDFGAKIGPNSSMLVNKNIFDDKSTVHEFTFGSSWSGRFGTNIGDYFQLNLEYGASNINQRWRMNTDAGDKFWREFDLKSSDFATLVRIHTDGSFIEFGPQFSTIKSVDLENSGEAPSSLHPGGDVTALYNEKYVSGIFGFGSYIIGNGNLSLIMGFRTSIGFSDLIHPDTQINYEDFPAEYTSFDTYEETKVVSLQLFFELNFDLGYLARANCKTRSAFVFF